jgi:hypothetical protein
LTTRLERLRQDRIEAYESVSAVAVLTFKIVEGIRNERLSEPATTNGPTESTESRQIRIPSADQGRRLDQDSRSIRLNSHDRVVCVLPGRDKFVIERVKGRPTRRRDPRRAEEL